MRPNPKMRQIVMDTASVISMFVLLGAMLHLPY